MFSSCGLPALFSTVLLVREFVGDREMAELDSLPWCWISNTNTGHAWNSLGAWTQMVFFYIPISIIMCLNSILYLLILKSMPTNQSMTSRVKSRIFYYFIVFFGCSIWGVMNRILQVDNK